MNGDDIGNEVVPEAVKVMSAAAAKTGLAIEWHEFLLGKAGHEKYGNTLPPVRGSVEPPVPVPTIGQPVTVEAGQRSWVPGAGSLTSNSASV